MAMDMEHHLLGLENEGQRIGRMACIL
jgi:hypothetical protein